MRVERHKKRFDILTYKEIVAFTEGKELSKIEKEWEKAKSPYQKVFCHWGRGAVFGSVRHYGVGTRGDIKGFA